MHVEKMTHGYCKYIRLISKKLNPSSPGLSNAELQLTESWQKSDKNATNTCHWNWTAAWVRRQHGLQCCWCSVSQHEHGTQPVLDKRSVQPTRMTSTSWLLTESCLEYQKSQYHLRRMSTVLFHPVAHNNLYPIKMMQTLTQMWQKFASSCAHYIIRQPVMSYTNVWVTLIYKKISFSNCSDINVSLRDCATHRVSWNCANWCKKVCQIATKKPLNSKWPSRSLKVNRNGKNW